VENCVLSKGFGQGFKAQLELGCCGELHAHRPTAKVKAKNSNRNVKMYLTNTTRIRQIVQAGATHHNMWCDDTIRKQLQARYQSSRAQRLSDSVVMTKGDPGREN
jgi:hypothetical protein